MSNRSKWLLIVRWMPALVVLVLGWSWAETAPCAERGDVVLKIVMLEDEDEDPVAAGKAAAKSLKKQMGDTPLEAVIVSECFEDREPKQKLLQGICSVLPKEIVMGGATYGSFTQEGCTDFDSVCLLGIGGDGIAVSARLVILIPDAHAPKNQYLVEGMQQVLGGQFPITGGCVNKNAGQTFVYFKGKMYEDAALAVMLSGDFQVSLSGRQANEEKKVIATANQGAREALEGAKGEPVAALAFNCAGRRSKLNDYGEELTAMQKALGRDLPLFGCYCAGEIGPVDNPDKPSDALCGGSGWHVMFTIIAQ